MGPNTDCSISIIIPCYNSEKWIGRCLDSITAKEKEIALDFEIIVINDCSNDETSVILEKYQATGAIRYINLTHPSGVSKARNTGIKEAIGRYIWCIDSDDYILPNAWSEITDMLRKFPAQDMYAFGYEAGDGITAGFKRGPFRGKSPDGLITSTSEGLFQLFSGMRMYPWNKIIKRDLFLKHPFPEGKIFEDIYTISSITADCKTIYWKKEALIFYYSNPESTSAIMLPERCENLYFSLNQFLLEYGKIIPKLSKKTRYSINSFHLKHCIDAICHMTIYNEKNHLPQNNTLDLIEIFTKTLLPQAKQIQRGRLCNLRYQIWRADRRFLNYLMEAPVIDVEEIFAIAIKRIKPKNI